MGNQLTPTRSRCGSGRGDKLMVVRPIPDGVARGEVDDSGMKHHHSPQPLHTGPFPRVIDLAERRKAEAAFVPSPDEVSRRAYFTYVNQGSLPGHEVQHWLQAEAELIHERDLARTHGIEKASLTA